MKMHCCVAAYISDYAFLGTALLPHQWRHTVHFMVSLDHSMWFHNPFRADHWMLYECESPWAGEYGATGTRVLMVGGRKPAFLGDAAPPILWGTAHVTSSPAPSRLWHSSLQNDRVRLETGHPLSLVSVIGREC